MQPDAAPPIEVRYRPAGAVLAAFHRSDAFVRGIMGPIGSGKSTACVVEILRRAQQQQPGPDGVRRSRWAIIRNTYAELRTTTLRTWESWAPLHVGKFVGDAPIMHRIEADGLDCEVLFLALDRPEDAKKLLSLELTGAWINEAREVPKAILDTLTGRVGRFPSVAKGGCTWSGVLLDTNAPEVESWWYRLAEVDRPEGWAFFRQPAAVQRIDGAWHVTADAENLANLPAGYYSRLLGGKADDWIKIYSAAEYGFSMDGKAVFTEYADSVHVSTVPLVPLPGLVTIGCDFGLTPAAIYLQRDARGRVLVLGETVAEDMGATRFGETIAQRYEMDFAARAGGARIVGDPAGGQRSQVDERTVLDVLRAVTGWAVEPAPTNDVRERLEVVRVCLGRMIEGKPGLLIDPSCTVLRKALSGGYCYRRMQVGGGERFADVPDKNAYSHPADALQYGLLGLGEGSAIRRQRQRWGDEAAPRDETMQSYNPHDFLMRRADAQVPTWDPHAY